ncbi:hypothetical protein SISSUDRAFT_1129933 [Sistotremastrum suecicum HHB10207 ss-3]|uniref:Uncharacterized protein n=1 Tax=Sistotremastrum suecicum HHB10207 ss-3 TaxID=1314776 RepID=A0A166C385_9AGAM|nr:hypothetical protein SISSUDRAFT_1129933 [Sistotremastrum suecicum HHB10207 ss-3]
MASFRIFLDSSPSVPTVRQDFTRSTRPPLLNLSSPTFDKENSGINASSKPRTKRKYVTEPGAGPLAVKKKVKKSVPTSVVATSSKPAAKRAKGPKFPIKPLADISDAFETSAAPAPAPQPKKPTKTAKLPELASFNFEFPEQLIPLPESPPSTPSTSKSFSFTLSDTHEPYLSIPLPPSSPLREL